MAGLEDSTVILELNDPNAARDFAGQTVEQLKDMGVNFPPAEQ
jgi:hypothetical protein